MRDKNKENETLSSHRMVVLIRDHFPLIILFYIWLGLFICGWAAPASRLADLGLPENGVFMGLASVLLLPVILVYIITMRKRKPAG